MIKLNRIKILLALVSAVITALAFNIAAKEQSLAWPKTIDFADYFEDATMRIDSFQLAMRSPSIRSTSAAPGLEIPKSCSHRQRMEDMLLRLSTSLPINSFIADTTWISSLSTKAQPQPNKAASKPTIKPR